MKYNYTLHDDTRPDRDPLKHGQYHIENRDTHQYVASTTHKIVALNLLDIFNERGFEIETAVRA